MKIWITRDVTGSIHSGGLERLHVWFQEPTFFYGVKCYKDFGDMPFGSEKEGLGKVGWFCYHGNNKLSKDHISFGKLFGYGDSYSHPNYIEGFADYIWRQLSDHYGNTRFVDGWYEYENSGKCKQENFLLQIDLNVSFIPN